MYSPLVHIPLPFPIPVPNPPLTLFLFLFVCLFLLELDEHLLVLHRLSGLDVDRLHNAVDGRREGLLHLHRLEHHERGTGRHLLSNLNVHRHHGTRHGRDEHLRGVNHLGRRHDGGKLGLQRRQHPDRVRGAHVLHVVRDLRGGRQVLEGLGLGGGLAVNREHRLEDGLADLPLHRLQEHLGLAHLHGERVVGRLRHRHFLDTLQHGRLELGRLRALLRLLGVLELQLQHRRHGGHLRRLHVGQHVSGEAVRVRLRQVVGRDVAVLVHVRREHVAHQRDVVAQAANDVVVQRQLHVVDALLAGVGVRDQLRDHRVVVHRDLRTLLDAGVHTDTLAHGLDVALQHADRRGVVARGVLGVHTALGGPAVDLDVLLAHRQVQALGRAEHLVHQVQARDLLRHRVLDLQTRVHLEEVEVLVLVDKHLNRAGRVVVDRARERHSLLTHRGTRVRVDEGRGCLLDDLLVPALDRALALRQVHDVAQLVSDHLHLDVARILDELLHEHAVVAERGHRLALCGVPLAARLLLVPRDAQTLAAAAGGGLDHDGVAQVLGHLEHALLGLDLLLDARDAVDARLRRQHLRVDLVSHRLNRVRRRTDELDALGGEGLGEGGVLAEEAVSGVDGVNVQVFADLENAVHAEVRVTRRSRSDVHSLVRHLDVLRVHVRGGVHRHRRDAELLAGLEHPACDLTTVGHKQLVEVLRVALHDLHLRALLRAEGTSTKRLETHLRAAVVFCLQ
eukprot:Rhum_TRINITY_DN22840_c0_g1::Rhum_TRINITY_DN22840_c0_g1_i1::g.176253::m.176253